MNSQSTDMTQYMPAPEQRSVTAQAMTGRQAQEVQMMLFAAKQFPRDENVAYAKIMKACSRKILAETAMYEYPRGGQKVTGPSIRLAEVLAQNWGNIDFGVIELEQKNGESSMMAYAWDLETNTRQTKVFTVKHERKAKGSINKLDDPRDIYEMTANQGARRVRACILGVIPGDFVEAAIKQCEITLKNGHKEPLSDRVRQALVLFERDYGVSKEMIEQYVGCKADSFSEQDFLKIGRVYNSLKDGMAKREDYFDIRISQEVGSKAEEQFKKQQQEQGGVKPDAGAEQQ
ncbi:hypothetical protein [Brevibacillus borstelensis]|uniref:hypothetical protein n=1 Tax=Brevibacillus borstelensis TaxID=45462 RepID=UPI0004F3C519|nr:hypothetical protein X546_20565 [Brevibacillus borstelensis cifa_chp40]